MAGERAVRQLKCLREALLGFHVLSLLQQHAASRQKSRGSAQRCRQCLSGRVTDIIHSTLSKSSAAAVGLAEAQPAALLLYGMRMV